MRRAVGLAIIVWAALGGIARGQTVALCEAANVDFPQTCGCVVDRARASGIDGPALDRLVQNDAAGIPIDVFQAYGLIYVQCIQQAVLGQLPGGGEPTPPSASQPATTPQPVADAAPPLAREAIVITAPTLPGQPTNPLTMEFPQAISSGQWGGITLSRAGEGRLLRGTHDGGGHLIGTWCDFQRSTLLLGGVVPASPSPQVDLVVLNGRGSEIARRVTPGLMVDERFVLMPLFRDIAEGLRRGSMLRVSINGDTPLEFGLSGSNAAMGPGDCGIDRILSDRYLADPIHRPGGGWTLAEGRLFERPAPYLIHEAQAPFVPTIALTCDRRLVQRSRVFGYGRNQGEIVVADQTLALRWQDVGGQVATDPLSDDLIAQLAGASTVTITFDTDVEPGEFTIATYTMAGFADGLETLECPAPLPAPTETARTDLTAQGFPWRPGDIGPALPPALDGTPTRFPIAYLDAPAGLPSLSVGCDGIPFFAGGDWDIITGELRMTLDGDPTTTFDQFYGNYRSFLNPGGFPEAVTPDILDGGTLRVMSVEDPALDILYPLDGLPAALAQAGC